MLVETLIAVVGIVVVSAGASVAVTVPAVALILDPCALRPVLARLATAATRRFTAEASTVLGTRLDSAPATEVDAVVAGAEARTRWLDRRGPYRLVRLIAQGATTQLWEALDLRDATAVAFKCLPPGHRDGDLSRARERLAREGVALAAASGTHVVALHEAGEIGGAPFVAMRLATGGTLLEALHTQPDGMAPDAVLTVVAQLADALTGAHRAGWVHRDVKASNVVYDPVTQRWLLCDFGIAQPLGEPARDRLTAPGYVVGTPGHLAPELLADTDDAAATPASDVYALAALTCQLLTGHLPGPPAHRQAALGTRRPELAALDVVLHRALAPDPTRRYPTPAAFAHTLTRVAAATTPPGPGLDAVSGPTPPRARAAA